MRRPRSVLHVPWNQDLQDLLAREAKRLGIPQSRLATLLLARCLTDRTHGPLRLADPRPGQRAS